MSSVTLVMWGRFTQPLPYVAYAPEGAFESVDCAFEVGA